MIYDYECSGCKHRMLNVVQSLKDKPKRKCLQCKKMKLERIILSPPKAHISNVTTLGQQAEINHKKRGKYKASEDAMAKKEKEASSSAFLGSLTKSQVKKLQRMTKKQAQNYVMTGHGL